MDNDELQIEEQDGVIIRNSQFFFPMPLSAPPHAVLIPHTL